MLLHYWIIFLTSCTLYGILRMSSLFLHFRNRTLKSFYNTTIRRKCVILSNLKLLLLCYFLFQFSRKIDIRKSRIENLKEVSTRETLSFIKDLFRRYGTFRKILLILSWDINLNPGTVHGIQNENLLHVLPFHDCGFSGDEFYYKLNSLSEDVSRNDWDVFKKRECI